MKKVFAFFVALFLAFSVPTVPVVPAQMSVSVFAPVSAPAPAPSPVAMVSPSTNRVGVVAAVGGKVELTTFGQTVRIAQSGQAIFMGDEVKTDAQGRLQVLLLDETVFTIGPNSVIIIDKFVYDPKSQKGEIRASITQGVFRYVSGKIAAKNPDSVKVKLPAATLGFRGTIVGGSVGANGQGLAALLGPGNNNDTGAQTGSFTIDGDGGDHQNVNRTGFGVEVGADGGVSDVFQLSDEQINGLTQGLGGGQGGGGQQGGGGDGEGGLGGNTDMGALSGENNVLAGDNVTLASGLNNINNNMDVVSILGAQDALNASGLENFVDETCSSTDTTTYEQLLAASGSGFYNAVGGTFGGESGDLNAYCEITFGALGSIGGGGSWVSVSDGTWGDSTSIGSGGDIPFAGGSGPAIFTWNETGVLGGVFDITVTLSNSGGVTAENAVISVNYEKGIDPDTPSSGSGTATGTFETPPT
ncbi:MAG: FecR domain-containing protein [Candidatus Omnitrophota bacterium]